MGKDLKKKWKEKKDIRYTVVDGAKKLRSDDKDSKMPNDSSNRRKLNQLASETVELIDNYNIINFEILKSFFDLPVCPNFGKKIKLNKRVT